MQRKEAILKLRISEDLKEEAEKIAREKGESLSYIIREALRRYLDQASPAPVEPAPVVPVPFPFTPDQLQALQRSGAAINAARLRRLVDYLETDPDAQRVAEDPEPSNGHHTGPN
jgi:hypothetical protein